MLIVKKVLLLITFFVAFPIIVNGGIICNDGWESSCIVSGPGCCSHHGGVAGNYSNYSNSNNNYYDDESEFAENLENGEYTGLLIFIILVLPFMIGVIIELKAQNSDSNDDLE